MDIKTELDDNLKKELKKIVELVNSLEGRIPEEIVDPMFKLHNNLFKIQEFNKGCGTCRNRTFGRLQGLFNEIILNGE